MGGVPEGHPRSRPERGDGVEDEGPRGDGVRAASRVFGLGGGCGVALRCAGPKAI
jgi:hypothetical protein